MYFLDFKYTIYCFADLLEIFRFKKKRNEFLKILYRDKKNNITNNTITNIGRLQDFRKSYEYIQGSAFKFWSKIKFDWAPNFKIRYNKSIFLKQNETIEFQQNSELKAIQMKILKNYEKKPIIINIYFFPNNLILIKLEWSFHKKISKQEKENFLSTSDIIEIENLFKSNKNDISNKNQFNIEVTRGRKPRRKEILNISDIFHSLYLDIFNWTRSYSRRRGIKKKKKVSLVDPKFNLEFYHIIEPKEIISHGHIFRDIKGIMVLEPFYNECYRNETIDTINKMWSKCDRVFNDLNGAYIYNKCKKKNYEFFRARIELTKNIIQFNWLRMRGYIRISEFLRAELLDIKNDSRLFSMFKMFIGRLSWINDYLLTSFGIIASIEDFRYSLIKELVKNCDDRVKNGIKYRQSLNYFLDFSNVFRDELEKIKQQNFTIAESIGKIVTSLTKT